MPNYVICREEFQVWQEIEENGRVVERQKRKFFDTYKEALDFALMMGHTEAVNRTNTRFKARDNSFFSIERVLVE